MMVDENKTAKQQLISAIGNWLKELDSQPSWREWQRSKIGYTLRFDDEFLRPQKLDAEFMFSAEVESQHALILSYMEILSTAASLRDVEWYFRRYPFSRTPVTRNSHLRYCCEMYFSRFYQFKERLKNLSKALKLAVPNNGLDFGDFIKRFDKEFENEIRARNSVHHRETFDDIGISRIAILEMTDPSDEKSFQKRLYQSHYRKESKEWAARTRQRADALDRFVEGVAVSLLKVCPFLKD